MNLKYKKTLRACYLGYITQAITVNLSTLFFVIFRNDFGITYSEIANIILFTFVVQIVVDGIMVKLIYKIGYRAAAISAHIFAASGLLMLGILPFVISNYIGILISVFFYSVGGGIIEVVISPIVDSLPNDGKGSGMCMLHSFYSWGQVMVMLFTTIGLKLIGSSHWFVLPILWAILPIFNIIYFSKALLPKIDSDEGKAQKKTLFSSPVVYLAVLLMICAGAAEMSMSQWASLFAEQGLGVSKVTGDLLGPCLFALNMGIGRTIYGIFGEKLNISVGIISCSILTLACYLFTIFASLPIFSLLGCALCGFGVSLMWPGVLSMTSEALGNRAVPSLFAALALAGDVGCSTGPWISGIVSDKYAAVHPAAGNGANLRAGMFASSAFPLIMIIASFFMAHIIRKRKSKT